MPDLVRSPLDKHTRKPLRTRKNIINQSAVAISATGIFLFRAAVPT
jgi:hypothetical protein